jgi:hypothetical protein
MWLIKIALTSIPLRYRDEKTSIIPLIMHDTISSPAPPEGASRGNIPALQVDREDPKVSFLYQVGGND